VEAAADGKTAERLAIDGEFDILMSTRATDQTHHSDPQAASTGVGPVLILSARRSVDDRVRV